MTIRLFGAGCVLASALTTQCSHRFIPASSRNFQPLASSAYFDGRHLVCDAHELEHVLDKFVAQFFVAFNAGSYL